MDTATNIKIFLKLMNPNSDLWKFSRLFPPIVSVMLTGSALSIFKLRDLSSTPRQKTSSYLGNFLIKTASSLMLFPALEVDAWKTKKS